MTAPGPAPDRAAADALNPAALEAAAKAMYRFQAPISAIRSPWSSIPADDGLRAYLLDSVSIAVDTYLANTDLTAELDRQRVIVRAAEALVECDAAKPGLGQSISVWRRQRRELLDALAAAVCIARPEGETDAPN